MTLFLGIDPGRSGGIAWLDENGHCKDVLEMPMAGGETNLGLLRSHLCGEGRPVWAAIEKQQPMPKQGIASSCRLMRHYGELLGTLSALDIPTHRVNPAAWKRATGTPRDKRAAVRHAQDLYPMLTQRFYGPRGGARDGLAEAVLIARFCWLEHGQRETTA